MRLWSGDLHSHPGGIGRPSGRSGPGLGDLGYVQAVFEANEAMQFFAMPIVVGAGTSQVTIHPWICMRDRPLQLLAAEVRICEVDKFPDRVFNPAWEQTVSEQKELIAQPFAIRVDVLRQHLQHASVRTVVEIKDALLLERAGLEIIVAIPQNFPLVPPQLKIRRPTGLQEFSPIPWAKFSVTSPEERLARLCNWIFNAYLMRF